MLVWFDLESIGIWQVRQVGEKHVSRGQHDSHPKGAGPQRPQNIGDRLHVGHGIRNNNQINSDQTTCEGNFTGSTTNVDVRSVCGS